MRAVQDAYAAKYLSMIGVDATPGNKSLLLRERPLEGCQVRAIWSDEDLETATTQSSSIALALNVSPGHRIGMLSDLTEGQSLNHAFVHKWYGKPSQINVKEPESRMNWAAAAAAAPVLDHQPGAGSEDAAHGASPAAAYPAAGGVYGSDGVHALAAELEGLRTRAPPKADDEEVALLLDRANMMRAEFESLKRKYIVPFACERFTKGSGGQKVLAPWSHEGTLELIVPKRHLWEVRRPINLSLPAVRKANDHYVQNCLPLDMLTLRRDDRLLRCVREQLVLLEVSKLIGLLAHLLYWLVLGVNREVEEQRITDDALSALIASVHQSFATLESKPRTTALGVTLVLPALFLILKRGVERCFEVQYPGFMKSEILHEAFVGRLNTLMMRLFDQDCLYSRFGRLDASSEAIWLQRQLDLLDKTYGRTKAEKMQSLEYRTTPLMRSALGCRFEDTSTRKLMLQGTFQASPRQAANAEGRPLGPASVNSGGQQELLQVVLGRVARDRDGMASRQTSPTLAGSPLRVPRGATRAALGSAALAEAVPATLRPRGQRPLRTTFVSSGMVALAGAKSGSPWSARGFASSEPAGAASPGQPLSARG